MPITSKELKLKVLTLQAKVACYKTEEAKQALEKAKAKERKAMQSWWSTLLVNKF